MDARNQSECTEYRMVVFSNAAREILVLRDATAFRLPMVVLQRGQRPAQTTTSALKSEWNCEAVCLFELNVAVQTDVCQHIRYQVLESWNRQDAVRNPACWVPVEPLSASSFADSADYAAVQQALGNDRSHSDGPAPGPFARSGWFEDLRRWIQEAIAPLGLQLGHCFCQINASPTFALIRFETGGIAVWFKAVGEPNAREFSITVVLAELFPRYIPSLIATKQEWNAWLSLEATGSPLEQMQSAVDWEAAAVALARLQIESVGRGDRLLHCGAHDLRVSALDDLVDPFIAAASELMEQQVRVPPVTLDRQELVVVGQEIHAALGRLEKLSFPETLGHLDINPGNIIVSAPNCAFLDWGEAYVGSPLFTFQYLLEHLRRTAGSDSAVERRLVAAYTDQWREVVPLPAIEESLSLVPLLAAFAYAGGSSVWSGEMKLRNPEAGGYVRSLTRRMHREAMQLADRRLQCLSL